MLLSIRAETTSLKAHTRLFPQHKGLALWREQFQEKCLLDISCFWASLLGEGWCSTCQKGHVWNCKNSSRVCIGPGGSHQVVGSLLRALVLILHSHGKYTLLNWFGGHYGYYREVFQLGIGQAAGKPVRIT